MKPENSKAFVWSTLTNLTKLIFSFITPIILARLLGPEAFGVIAMAYVLVGLSQIFIDFGSTEAIVKSRYITKKFLSSLFWFNFALCVLVFLIVLSLTPLISEFFQRDQLKILIPLLSIGMFFQVASIVPTSIFRRNKDFRPITIADAISRFLSSCLAILSAILGAEVYSLVVLSLSQSFIYYLVITYKSHTKIHRYFSFKYLRLVFSFTLSLLYIKVVNHVERHSDRLFIGPSFGDAALGIYTRGLGFQKGLQRFLSGSFNPVFFSVITRENSENYLKSLLEQSYQGFFLLMYPLFLYFYFFSKDLVLMLFGEEWKFMIDLLPYFAFLFLIRPFQKVNQEIIKAKGNIYFLAICFTVLTPSLIVSYYLMPPSVGIYGYIVAYVLVSLLFLITSMIYVGRLLHLKGFFFLNLFMTFLPRIFFLTLLALGLKELVDNTNAHFLNLILAGLVFLFFTLGFQRIFAMEAQVKIESLLMKVLGLKKLN